MAIRKSGGLGHDGAGLWAASGPSSHFATSSDGIEWTQRDHPLDGAMIRAIAHDQQGLWVVAGAAGKLATSSDGVEWTQRDAMLGDEVIYSVAHGDGLWVAAGTEGALATSTDGVVWTKRNSSFGGSKIASVAHDGVGLWVAGGDGKIATSTDGVVWTPRESTFHGNSIQRAIARVAHDGDGQWLAVGNGKIASSPGAGPTHILPATDFGFSIPSDAEIAGLEVELVRRGRPTAGNAVADERIHLIVDQDALGEDRARADRWRTEWSEASYESSGANLVDVINTETFGVAISAEIESGQAEIDTVSITVHYRP